ncbi:MAG: LysR family transcriptional regulator [Rhizobiales bacterium]|nr:LysR family transcriptional regulator [Hyphomicrobiales bacterium]
MHKNEHNLPASEHLVTFLTVTECQNITHAGDRLGRTQSAISVQIRKLEEFVETRLFERQSRGMVLTDDGRKLIPVARRAVAELDRVAALFRQKLEGRIRLGIPDDYSESILEKVVTEFAQRHPAVEIFTRSGCTSKFPEAIRRMELDMAVHSGPDIDDADVIAEEQNVWAAADTFEVGPGAAVPLALLIRECSWRTIPTDALDKARKDWKVAYASENFTSIKAAIRAGLAVGVLPACLVEPGMRVLGKRDGFPPLPVSRRGLLVGKHAPSALAEAMSEAIQTAIVK